MNTPIKNKNPYVHSNFERILDDNYQTIDKRCIYGFLEQFIPTGLCIDVCAPNGSGIVDTLNECGYSTIGIDSAFDGILDAQWVITNPPYKRGLVDSIINKQIERLENNEVNGVAVLLRANFDFAKSRWDMFHHHLYAGQIKLLFRPWWNENREISPIHNFVWHIWKISPGFQTVRYSKGIKPDERPR